MRYLGLLMVALAGPLGIAAGLSLPEAAAILVLAAGGQSIWLLNQRKEPTHD